MHLTYYILLSSCLIVAILLKYLWKINNITTLVLLLFISIFVEISVDVLKVLHIDHHPIYHFYIPCELILLTLFFKKHNQKKWIKKLMLFSIPFFAIVNILISLFIIPIFEFPGIQFNIEGFVVILFSIITLFNLEVNENLKIYAVPIFWFCLGLLIFHSGIFFLNGLYNHFYKINSIAAKELNVILNGSLNNILYIFWLYSLICSLRIKKY